MIFFKNEIDVSKVFLIEDNDTKAIEKIKEIGEWVNPPSTDTYTDKIAIYSYLYGHEGGLRNEDLTGFVSILTTLITDMGASFGFPRKKDCDIEEQGTAFLNSFQGTGALEDDKAKALAFFLSNLYLTVYKDVKLVKKTIMLPVTHVTKINESIEGSSFSDKIRNLISDYFKE